MKIYVVETVFDYCIQVGFSTSKAIAEKKAKELKKVSKALLGNRIHNRKR